MVIFSVANELHHFQAIQGSQILGTRPITNLLVVAGVKEVKAWKVNNKLVKVT